DDYFQKGDPALATPDMDKITEHLPHAIRMELGPGDMVYWPSSHWHVVLSDGAPSAVVQVSAYFGKNMSAFITNRIQSLLVKQSMAEKQDVYKLRDTPADLPQCLAGVHDRVRELLVDGELEDDLQQHWLKLHTADGFDHVPPADPPVEIAPSDYIVLNRLGTVGWTRSARGGLTVVVNGLAFTAEDDARLTDLLGCLNTGGLFRVEDLIAQFSSDQDSAASITRLIGELHQRRAFSETIKGHMAAAA
ncbi:MAG: hypothetical protein N2C12_10660, partial [Planctomycetales bacterium]